MSAPGIRPDLMNVDGALGGETPAGLIRPPAASADERLAAPTEHLLGAAWRVAGILARRAEPITRIRTAYGALPSGGVYGRNDYQRGEALLMECELVKIEEGRLWPDTRLAAIADMPAREAARILFQIYLTRRPPPWLAVAVRPQGVEETYVPDRDRRILSELFADSDEREAALIAAADRHDPERRSEVGEAGEEAVVEACRAERLAAGLPDLAADVRRVSLLSDRLGYDVVAPNPTGRPYRMEVKTSSLPGGAVDVYLSRAQARVGRKLPGWRLVACRMTGGTARVVGWCMISDLESSLPRDASSTLNGIVGTWEKARLRLQPTHLTPGLPPLGAVG